MPDGRAAISTPWAFRPTATYFADGFERLRIALRNVLEALEVVDETAIATPAAAQLSEPSHLTSALERSAALCLQRMQFLAEGARLRGLDELISNLDDLRASFAYDGALLSVTFLIGRCVAAFETTIENALSGYLSISMDSMRDVLVIENLLLNLAVDPQRIDRWLHADARTLRTIYSPAEVRNRLHRAQVGALASSAKHLSTAPTARPCACGRATIPSRPEDFN